MPPVVALAAAGRLAPTCVAPSPLGRRRPVGLAVVASVALAYTTPWDNYLVGKGVWRYGDGLVAATVWHAPVGEYLFVVLQTLVVALWLYRVADRRDDGVTAADDGGGQPTAADDGGGATRDRGRRRGRPRLPPSSSAPPLPEPHP